MLGNIVGYFEKRTREVSYLRRKLGLPARYLNLEEKRVGHIVFKLG